MHFSFNVNLSEEDYFKFNKFVMLRSHYGKKQIRQLRVITAVLAVLLMLLFAFAWGFSLSTLIGIIPMAILFGALEIIIPKILTLSLKWQIKGMKKSGKMPYTPTSVIEFYDERWGETSEDTKTELSYSGIERISVVFEDAIYIQINNVI